MVQRAAQLCQVPISVLGRHINQVSSQPTCNHIRAVLQTQTPKPTGLCLVNCKSSSLFSNPFLVSPETGWGQHFSKSKHHQQRAVVMLLIKPALTYTAEILQKLLSMQQSPLHMMAACQAIHLCVARSYAAGCVVYTPASFVMSVLNTNLLLTANVCHVAYRSDCSEHTLNECHALLQANAAHHRSSAERIQAPCNAGCTF